MAVQYPGDPEPKQPKLAPVIPRQQSDESIPVVTDAKMQQAVDQFLREYQREPQPGEAQDEQEQQPRARIAEDPIVAQESPQDMYIREAAPDIQHAKPTTPEKDLYMKALLCDTPVQFPVVLFGGQLVLEFRSRTLVEQERILDVVKLDVEENIIPKSTIFPQGDPALIATKIQQYLTALMLRRVNDVGFSSLTLSAEESVKDSAVKLREFVQKHIARMSHIRWTGIFNGLRIFENKCRIMGEECYNEDFWKPRGQD